MFQKEAASNNVTVTCFRQHRLRTSLHAAKACVLIIAVLRHSHLFYNYSLSQMSAIPVTYAKEIHCCARNFVITFRLHTTPLTLQRCATSLRPSRSTTRTTKSHTVRN